MDTNQIESALRKKFDQHRIVFWNDPEREFFDLVSAPPLFFLQGVSILRLDQLSALEAKLRIERQDPTKKYLLYCPCEEPDYETDWLLDIRLYADNFRADRASIILSELGLDNHSLRQHLHDRRKFFDAKDRVKKLQAMVTPHDTAADLDLKMLAVLTKADQPELFTVVRTLLHAFVEDNDNGIDLAKPPAVWEQISKYDLEPSFWNMVKDAFGYTEESPTLRNFVIRLLVSDLHHHLREQFPQPLAHLSLPPATRPNVVVCLAQWRDSTSKSASYDLLSNAVAKITSIEDYLSANDIDVLLEVMTFLAVEKVIIRGLKERVKSTAETVNPNEIRRITTRRQAGHWASLTVAGDPSVPREALHGVYDALVAAAEFFDLRNRHKGGFDFETAQAMYRAYEGELHRFDQLYRHFCENADAADAQHWDVLKGLRDDVEAVYANWFLPTLALAWGKFVSPPTGEGLLAKWRIEGVKSQQNFYEQLVKPLVTGGEYKRVFVVISDAMRYEVGAELVRELNGKYRFEADLASMLSVLPSYTALGMASLLPRKSLAYRPSGEVLVDGKVTQSLDQRGECLAAVGGMAVKADDLMVLKREEGRERVKSFKVVYVYHDTIDATGDKQASEKETFHAARRAINEVAALVGHLVNNLNAHLVYVTADHGFLFTETAPGETGKSAIQHEPSGTVLAKRRYLLGQKLPEDGSVWHGSTEVTAGADGGMEFWLPRGVNRFHFVGGSRYAHGGAMPQEVVVPLITVKHIRGKAAEQTQTKQVAVHVLGAKHKVTTSRHRFELIQMEPVSERVTPVTLRIAIYEGTEAVTEVVSVTFDSASGNMDERKKWVSLTLKERQYDKKTPYRLVLREADTDLERQSVEVTIDRAFSDDF